MIIPIHVLVALLITTPIIFGADDNEKIVKYGHVEFKCSPLKSTTAQVTFGDPIEISNAVLDDDFSLNLFIWTKENGKRAFDNVQEMVNTKSNMIHSTININSKSVVIFESPEVVGDGIAYGSVVIGLYEGENSNIVSVARFGSSGKLNNSKAKDAMTAILPTVVVGDASITTRMLNKIAEKYFDILFKAVNGNDMRIREYLSGSSTVMRDLTFWKQQNISIVGSPVYLGMDNSSNYYFKISIGKGVQVVPYIAQLSTSYGNEIRMYFNQFLAVYQTSQANTSPLGNNKITTKLNFSSVNASMQFIINQKPQVSGRKDVVFTKEIVFDLDNVNYAAMLLSDMSR